MKTRTDFGTLIKIGALTVALALIGCATINPRVGNKALATRFEKPIMRLAIAQTGGQHAQNAAIMHGILLSAGIFPEVFMPADAISPSADHVLVITAGEAVPTLLIFIGVPQMKVTADAKLYGVKNGVPGTLVWNLEKTEVFNALRDPLNVRKEILGDMARELVDAYRQYQATNPSPSKLAAQ